MLARIVVSFAVVVCMLGMPAAHAQKGGKSTGADSRILTVKPDYLPPAEILDFLDVSPMDGSTGVLWSSGDGCDVEIRRNDAANMLVLSGPSSCVEVVEGLIHEADVPPRQIVIEAKIVEVNQSMVRDLGIDWDRVLNTGNPRLGWNYDDSHQESDSFDRQRSDSWREPPYQEHTYSEQQSKRHSENDQSRNSVSATASVNLASVLDILDETGAGTVRNAPRILTLNNRKATILDGQRVTYVTRYSSYTNLYETETMDAGLTLSVLPSLGESGYLTLQLRAELTSLRGDVSGSPVKDGQIVENTIIAKDGETVLLGGFQRTSESTTKRRFPILGHVLPFLFSHEITKQSVYESYVVLTPHVVDLAAAIDDETRTVIEGQ